jgi:hypothetical protein
LVQERHLFGGQVIGPRAPRVRPNYEASARVVRHPMLQHFVGPSSPGGVIVGGQEVITQQLCTTARLGGAIVAGTLVKNSQGFADLQQSAAQILFLLTQELNRFASWINHR